jgi:hypothetical protein
VFEVQLLILAQVIAGVAHQGAPRRRRILLIADQDISQGGLAGGAVGLPVISGQLFDPLEQPGGPGMLFNLGLDFRDLFLVQQEVRMPDVRLFVCNGRRHPGEQENDGDSAEDCAAPLCEPWPGHCYFPPKEIPVTWHLYCMSKVLLSFGGPATGPLFSLLRRCPW